MASKKYPKYHIPSNWKIALILSGGGSKGSYSLGVIQYMIEELRIKPSQIKIIYGTSTGSLIAAQMGKYVISGDPKYLYDLIHIYSSVTNEDILEAHSILGEKIGGEAGAMIGAALAGEDSVYSMAPMERLVAQFMKPEEWKKLLRFDSRNKVDIGFAVSSLGGEREIINTARYDDYHVLHNALLASAKQPVFNSPTDLFNDGRLWVDGGLTDYSPIEWVFNANIDTYNGLDAIVSINLNTPGPSISASPDLNVVDIAFRTIAILIDQVFDADMANAQLMNLLLKVQEVCDSNQWKEIVRSLPDDLRYKVNNDLKGKKHLPIITIYPKRPLNYDGFIFQPAKAKSAIRQGFREAATWFSKQPV